MDRRTTSMVAGCGSSTERLTHPGSAPPAPSLPVPAPARASARRGSPVCSGSPPRTPVPDRSARERCRGQTAEPPRRTLPALVRLDCAVRRDRRDDDDDPGPDDRRIDLPGRHHRRSRHVALRGLDPLPGRHAGRVAHAPIRGAVHRPARPAARGGRDRRGVRPRLRLDGLRPGYGHAADRLHARARPGAGVALAGVRARGRHLVRAAPGGGARPTRCSGRWWP